MGLLSKGIDYAVDVCLSAISNAEIKLCTTDIVAIFLTLYLQWRQKISTPKVSAMKIGLIWD